MPNPTELQVVFFGTPEFAAVILNTLLDNKYNIVGVYTQPDKKIGRQQELKQSEVKILAERNNIPIFEPLILDEKVIDELKSLKPDLIIVIAYGKILPGEILTIPKFGAINIHPSLLPKFRGPSPIQNTLLQGEKETGTTIILMNEGMDTGPIIAQEKIEVDKEEIHPQLSQKLAALSSQLLINTLPEWISNKIEPVSQDDSKATLCQLIERSDGKVIWTNEAEKIHNQFRAMTPWPGLFCFWEKSGINFRIKLNKLSHLAKNPETKHHIGEVFQISDKVGVQTGEGVIFLEEVQMEGKKSMPVEEFLRGNPSLLGSILK